MTREEAIKVLLNEWKCIDRNDGVNCDRKCESCDLVMDSFVLKDAYNRAIKALEQKDEIEKIRAKVVSINPWALRYAPTYDEDIRPQIVSNVKEHVLEIIDKYKEDT